MRDRTRDAGRERVTREVHLPRMVKSPASSKPWLKGIMNQVNSWVALRWPQIPECPLIGLTSIIIVKICSHRASLIAFTKHIVPARCGACTGLSTRFAESGIPYQ